TTPMTSTRTTTDGRPEARDRPGGPDGAEQARSAPDVESSRRTRPADPAARVTRARPHDLPGVPAHHDLRTPLPRGPRPRLRALGASGARLSRAPHHPSRRAVPAAARGRRDDRALLDHRGEGVAALRRARGS